MKAVDGVEWNISQIHAPDAWALWIMTVLVQLWQVLIQEWNGIILL
ncbi:hypothetical protein ACEQPO_12315 [Bacillus sp. SL00103]